MEGGSHICISDWGVGGGFRTLSSRMNSASGRRDTEKKELAHVRCLLQTTLAHGRRLWATV